MGRAKFELNKINLRKQEELKTLIENKTTFTLKDCELSIYETHQSASNVKLNFEHLSFTGMLRGKKIMKIDGKTEFFDYLPGESVLVNAGESMIIDFPDADTQPSQCVSLSFNPEFIKSTLEQFNYTIPKIDENSSWDLSLDHYYLFNTPSLASATNNILRVAMDDDTHKDVIADFALKELLIKLMQTQGRNLVEQNLSKTQSRIGFIVDYIKKNLHDKLSIDSISKLAYVSKSNFHKLFKEELGISPNEFILKERIQLAKTLLEQNVSIKEVAFQTGFADTNYFTRVFKQSEGITPKAFQNNKSKL